MLYTQKAAGSSPASPTRITSGFTFQILTADSPRAPDNHRTPGEKVDKPFGGAILAALVLTEDRCN